MRWNLGGGTERNWEKGEIRDWASLDNRKFILGGGEPKKMTLMERAKNLVAG